jgi:pimeloyl-ACP methyl ester carboxylesterase
MEWLNREEYPFESKYMEIGNHKLHYIDEGNGEVLLFVHGTPSWSFDFRNVIKILKKKFRCIAFDHFGFGLSDKPIDYDYRTRNHANTLATLTEHLQLQNFSLVLHDFGGPIGFSYAIQHPDKIRSLIVLNSWMWSHESEPEFNKLKRILKNPLLPFLYLRLNFSARYLMPASFGDKKLTSQIRDHFTKPFSTKKGRYGTLAFARSLLYDQDWFQSLWDSRDVIADKPVLLIWGMKDKFVTANALNRFREAFMQHAVKTIDGAGHFPQEEEPGVVAAAICTFRAKFFSRK